MVSFSALLLPLAALATLAQAGSHAHHKRYRYQPHHYHNGTAVTTTFVTSSPLGTGIRVTELPTMCSSDVLQTLAPTSTHTSIKSAPVTTVSITKYEAKTYTYTFGNGKAHTTIITHTKVIPETVTPVLDPTKVDSSGDNHPVPTPEEEPEYTSTSTSTTTVFVTVTRTLTLPKESSPPVVLEETSQVPCPAITVYVTVPLSVSVSVISQTVVQTVKVTVKETVKETITTTQIPGSEQPPVHTPPPGHPPYSNRTITETVRQVTLTVVPIPYNT